MPNHLTARLKYASPLDATRLDSNRVRGSKVQIVVTLM
jgi:hypothetical protein